MRTIILLLLFNISGVLFAIDQAAEKPKEEKPKADAAAKDNASTNKTQNVQGGLTEAEEKDLRVIYTDEKSGITYSFVVFCPVHEKAKNDHDKLSYMIRYNFYEFKPKTKAKEPILKGTVNICIKNEKGEVVLSKKAPLKNPDGGVAGDIDRKGTYKLIIWMKHKDILYGKAMDMKLPPAK